MKTRKSQLCATKKWRERMLEKGFVSCNVWIPYDKREVIKEIAAVLRERKLLEERL